MIRALLTSVAAVLVIALAGGAAITYLALELGEVAIVETVNPDSARLRQTHIWYVHQPDGLYLEAGHPDNPWVRDLAQMQTLTLSGEGISGEYVFKQHESAADHQPVREMMRRKYGWRDSWIGVVFDTSQSRLIELEPAG
jgi:hypothetical protein